MRDIRSGADVAMGMRSLLAGSAALTANIVLAGAGAGASTAEVAATTTKTAATAAATATATATATRHATVTVRATATASAAAAVSPAPQTPIREGICIGPPGYRSVEARLSADIKGALRGRYGDHAVTVYDRATSVYCALNAAHHFDSASVVKAIILAALLRWHQETGEPLSANEKYLATLMITQSDNGAATALWNELGMGRLQHFLDLAKMNQTELGEGGYWGLTQVTAHDEMLLLELLTAGSPVLDAHSRSYQLGLMAKVISSQRWGTPAGAPAVVTVHVKNGWLPDSSGWHINSIGAFTGHGRNYMIAVLTDDNPSEQYGIDTIEDVARPVHGAINAAKPFANAQLAANVAASSAAPSPAAAQSPQPAPSPWAVVPALPIPPPAQQ
jgi:hypothetical protein